jgi:predicted Zn-dependent protease
MKKLFFAAIFIFVSANLKAQCNPDAQSIDSWYSWAKSWQNSAVDYFPISVEDEIVIGDSIHAQMSGEYVLDTKYAKQSYLDKIVKRLTANTKRKGIPYKIHVIDDSKTLNAFSIAGGHLYVTKKMVDYTTTEDELAFIIGHEIAHVDNRHGVRKVQQSMVGQSLFGEYGTLAANVSLLLTQPFGQIDEYEADREGAALVNKSGYDVRKGLRFFKTMSSQENYSTIEKMIRTHPYSAERYTCLEDFITNTLHK